MQDELNTDASPAETHHEKETMPSLEELLKAAELQAADHHDAWLRAKAETENMRRRAAEDVDKARKFAVENFASELLTVKDSLEAALVAESPSVENMKDGVELTLKQLGAKTTTSPMGSRKKAKKKGGCPLSRKERFWNCWGSTLSNISPNRLPVSPKQR